MVMVHAGCGCTRWMQAGGSAAAAPGTFGIATPVAVLDVV